MTCEHDWVPYQWPVGCALFHCESCGAWGIWSVRTVLAMSLWFGVG